MSHLALMFESPELPDIFRVDGFADHNHIKCNFHYKKCWFKFPSRYKKCIFAAESCYKKWLIKILWLEILKVFTQMERCD